MNTDKIITFMSIEDYNINLLSESKRFLKGKELEEAIIENIYNEMIALPGNIFVKIIDGMIVTEYDPYDLTEEDDRKFRKAINLLTERSFEVGEKLIEELIEDYPLNASLLYNLGMCYSEQGQYKKSIKPLEKAVEILPYYSEAYTALGFSYNGIGEVEKAIEYSKKAIELNKNNFYALRNLASLYGSIQKYEEAKRYIYKALDINPTEPSALYGAALIHKELSEINKVKELLTKIIDNGFDDRFIQHAKDLLRNVTSNEFSKDDVRMDAVMYLIGAIGEYAKMTPEEIQSTAFEIALLGKNGFKVGDPEIKYTIDSLGKECSGLQMVCYMYAGFQIIDPKLDIGFDLAKEYKMAKKMRANGI